MEPEYQPLFSGIQGALLRASLVDLTLHQMPTSSQPSEALQVILQQILHIKIPFDDSGASGLTKYITGWLKQVETLPWRKNGFDERNFMIQLLLHMHDSHILSKIHFLEFLQECKMVKEILRIDIDLQLKYANLSIQKLYKLLQDVKKIDTKQLTSALKKAVQDNYDFLQSTKLLRVLDLANRQNSIIYKSVDALISGSVEMTEAFATLVGQQYPEEYFSLFRSAGSKLLDLCSRRGKFLHQNT